MGKGNKEKKGNYREIIVYVSSKQPRDKIRPSIILFKYICNNHPPFGKLSTLQFSILDFSFLAILGKTFLIK